MSQDMLGVSLREVRGPLNTLMERLSGKDGKLWLRRLNRFNRGEDPFAIPYFFDVKTDGRSAASFNSSLDRLGHEVRDNAGGAIIGIGGTTKDSEYRLVVVRNRDLKLVHYAKTDQIMEFARSRGYLIPSPESALYLFEQLTEEHLKLMDIDWLTVMHCPLLWARGSGQLSIGRRITQGLGVCLSTVQENEPWALRNGWVFLQQ